jgi:hypothetical protein
VDKVGGIIEVTRTTDTHEIIISRPALQPASDGHSLITLSPRYARHLANVLIEHATCAEAEACGTHPKSRPYRRRGGLREG